MYVFRPFAILLLLLCAPVAFAATWGVSNTADTPVGQACAGFTNCSLREAVTSTELNPGPDAILVNGGTYPLSNGELTITQSLTVARVGAASAIIDAGNTSRVFNVTGGGTSLIVRFLIITQGSVNAGAGAGQGGTIFAAAGTSISVESTNIINGSVAGATAEGGAIYSLGTVTVGTAVGSTTASTLSSNTANASGGVARGGAIAVLGGALTIGPRTALMGDTITGAITEGGAISVRSLAAPLSIQQTLFGFNQAAGGTATGGALAIENSAAVIDGSTFMTNTAGASSITAHGGAIGAVGTAVTISITASTLYGNSISATGPALGSGGAIYNSTTTPSASTIRRSTIKSNAANGTASTGGALAGDPDPSSSWLIASSIVSGNVQAVGGDCGAGTFTSGNYNVFASSCAAAAQANDAITSSPGVNALASNGGITPTASLQPTSPALDRLPAAAPDCAGFATDQRGFARPYNGQCDSGAFEAANFPPSVTATGTNPTFTEGGAFVDLFSSVTVSTTEATQNILTITATVSNLADGASEIVNVDGTNVALTDLNSVTTANNGMTVSVAVSGSTATVTITKPSGVSAAIAQSIIDGLTYGNLSTPLTVASRTITLKSIQDSGGITDGGIDTTTFTIASIVNVVAANVAPSLSGGPVLLTGTDEDTPSGATAVSAILGSVTVTDPDAGALAGIAITVTTGNGTWEYSTDAVTWNAVAPVSDAAAMLLSSTTSVRYIPDSANGETASLLFRAWDQTSGTASTNSTRNTADTSTNGGATAFSSGTATANLPVSPVNDAPVLTPASPTLTAITEDDLTNPGQTVTSIVGASITDVDAGALHGVAITAATSASGSWEFSTDGGASWTAVTPVSNNSALLLRPADLVRVVPNGTAGGNATISYRAWDQTSGTFGTKADASTGGGVAAFSIATDTASLAITDVNDAPVNSIPVAQTTAQDTNLTFNSAGANLISVNDIDAGSGTIRITLTASQGLIDLGSLAGLSFVAGDGADDATITFDASIANANAALNGVVFKPATGYAGPASLQIVTDDRGLTGTGGIQIDDDTIAINVLDITAPSVTSVDLPSNGNYQAGQSLDLTVHFDEPVIVGGGTPSIPLTIGAVTRQAQYVSGSGTTSLLFRYVVVSGDIDTDGIGIGAAITLNTATIRDAAGNDATLALNGVPPSDGITVGAAAPAAAVPALDGAALFALAIVLLVTGVLRMRS